VRPHYSIHDAIKVSGLTRGQIDQSISRHGFPVHAGTVAPGQERRFSRHDIFWLSAIRRLIGHGIRWAAIPLLLEDVGAVQPTRFSNRGNLNRQLWHGEEEGSRYLTLWYGVRADADTGMKITIKDEEPRLQAVAFFPNEVETWQSRGMDAALIDLVSLRAEVDEALNQIIGAFKSSSAPRLRDGPSVDRL
jgi:DNA-binding transcriptional MerR regulator